MTQCACRPGRSANDAVKRVHKLLNTGHNEVVDCDLSNCFGEIPHAELMRSVTRRVSDGRMLGLIKAWLEMPVEEDHAVAGDGGVLQQPATFQPSRPVRSRQMRNWSSMEAAPCWSDEWRA